MTRPLTIAAILLAAVSAYAISPGQFEVGWIYENKMHRKPSAADFAVFHGDDCNFHVSYDKSSHRLVIISEANAKHAATDGLTPELTCAFGGCVNQVWIKGEVSKPVN